ncbi:TetR/AcrR family transcriptional regulator [Nocardia cyriacigeorgica]|uniref:TetR/AcrR family transcriptional regulator n=1 Tax=Nocardia cyriacigeorgica TaxID=135487 RepID=UPI0018950420|nr:TetR/AcrR family transcriptional regulator [Nocardia cyriacigeorgica]MBF6416042.1 TetR/AcrR family transcriptional regulator [Nocardia cyriacigeorgica]
MSRGTDTRARILLAAEQLMREAGLARTTTKEIARAAGCSEPALYRHFASKEELVVAVLQERLPAFGPLISQFTTDPADRTLVDCLVEIAVEATLFYEGSFAINVSLFSDPALLHRHREAISALGTGPHLPLQDLAGLLRAEQARGRVNSSADPDSAAAALLGACFQRAFLHNFHGRAVADADVHREQVREFAVGVVATVVSGIVDAGHNT